VPILATASENSKKKTYRSPKIKSEEIQQERLEYWQAIQGIATEQLVFIDETELWKGMERNRARSLKGQKVYGYRSQSKGKKQTLIGAITSKGGLCYTSIPWLTDKTRKLEET
jgi:hypothetical protein